MTSREDWNTKSIEGDPITVEGWQLTPIVRVRSLVRRGVTFGTHSASGRGGGFIWLHPQAIIQHHPDGREERIAIPDPTATAIKGMLVGAVALPILYLALTIFLWLWRRRPAP
jgi:hypothetical protein